MGKKIDWNSYIGKKNRFDVKICDWEEQKEKHTGDDKVVAICPDCGKYFTTRIAYIVIDDKRQTHGCKECGYKRQGIKKIKDYSSYFNKPNKFGVIPEKWEEEDKPIHYGTDNVIALCPDCGNEFVSSLDLIINEWSNQTHGCVSCGHKRNAELAMKKNELEPGSMWGFAKALYPGEPYVEPNGIRLSTTVCECTLCGKIFTTLNVSLKNGGTKSCGCLKSYLERKTSEYLVVNGIHFTHGLHFPAILTDKGYPVEFDFQIEDEYNNHIAFIECQGSQHFWTGEKANKEFGKVQREETDIKKKNYCKEHNLKLYEIRFDDDVEQRVNEILTELKLI